MKQHHVDSNLREAWILFMILGMVMINFPFIHIFDGDMTLLGIPRLVVYFMYGWPASIAVIWLFVRRLEQESQEQQQVRNNKSTDTRSQ
jgi:hypothetical protein